MLSIKSFLILLQESFRDLLPIVLVILFFQLAIIQTIPEGWLATSIGLTIVGVGLAVFLLGLEVAIFPVGESLASDFAKKGSTFWILIFAFLIGFGTTIAEPALYVIAQKAAAISSGRIDANVLRGVVAFSVGFAIVLGAWRIIKGHPIQYYIIAGYILVVATTAFAPHEIVGLAYDLGGVTTSTVTVPLVAALGIGLASTIKGRNPVLDGFGLIAFASLTPMIFVQVYGIVVYELIDVSTAVVPVIAMPEEKAVFDHSLYGLFMGLIGVVKDVVPILGIIAFFQYAVLKKPIENLKNVMIGFGLVIIGLYAFGFAIGFATTMAEPSLTAIAKKAKEISDGKINDFALRIFVAFGVAFGIALGSFRIVDGGQIVYYIIAGYLAVIVLTVIAPKYIIGIAYDSGGVTTSTITVPLVAALGLGLATNIEGRDPLVDGFGLIAFASLFPMITVMLYGVISDKLGLKGEHEKEEEHIFELRQALEDANDMGLATVNIDGLGHRHSTALSFSAVYIIIPKEKREQALKVAHKAGASGVTVTKAHGMGLDNEDNFYNRLEQETTDVKLMFLMPTKMVDHVIREAMTELDIVGEGHGIIYAYPLSHLKGISVKREHL